MEYQKIVNLLDNTMNQPSEFRIRNWVKINDESKRKCDNSSIRFKTSKIRWNWCYYSDTYILVKGTMTVPNIEAAGAAVNNTNKKVVFSSIYWLHSRNK